MIHTFEISYGLSLKDANTCVYRLNEITQAFSDKGYLLSKFLDIKREKGSLEFIVPDLVGIKTIKLSKFKDNRGFIQFRIYFMIEAEILRTGTDTLNLYFSSSVHAKELQTQYAKAIYRLFPESFNKRPAALLYHSGFAPEESYTKEEFDHSGLYALPYLPLASVRRMDLTLDLVSEDEEHAKLLTEMVAKSYYDGRKKIEVEGESKNPDDKDCYDKMYASGSKSFSVYYKYDKMFDDAYKDRPNIKQIQEESRNVTRIELSYTSNNRSNVKSLTWLDVPKGELPLGPLPYLANEQVPFIAFTKEYCNKIVMNYISGPKWYKLHELYKQVNNLVKAGKIKKREGSTIKKIARAIDKEGSMKPVRRRINGKNSKMRPCSPATYRKYRDLALKYNIMLTPIPKDKKIEELSIAPPIRNFDIFEVAAQRITRMLPYQSITETAPELEPVKDLYDAILSFLYGLYDQYTAKVTAMFEAAPECDHHFEE